MLDEYEKGAQAQDDAMAEEKHRQFEAVKVMIEERKAKVAETRRKKQEEVAKKAEQARLEKEKEIERIRNLRAKKEQLTKTLQEGQRLIYKQCYSRPLYSFNKKLNDQ